MNLRTVASFFAAGALLIAGGYNVEFGNPKANPDPKATDAAVIVRAVGCHEPEKATFTATVEGEKESIPVKLIPLSTPGTYAINKQWPDSGKRVLVVNAHFANRFVSSSVLPLKEGEPQRTLAKSLRRPATAADWQ